MPPQVRKAVILLGPVFIVPAARRSSSNWASRFSGGAVLLTELGEHVSLWLNCNSSEFHADALLAESVR